MAWCQTGHVHVQLFKWCLQTLSNPFRTSKVPKTAKAMMGMPPTHPQDLTKTARVGG
jgi:hypothetical protein